MADYNWVFESLVGDNILMGDKFPRAFVRRFHPDEGSYWQDMDKSERLSDHKMVMFLKFCVYDGTPWAVY